MLCFFFFSLGILGFNMTMNANASSEGKYGVYFFDDCKDHNDSLGCKRCLNWISDYHPEVSELLLQ